MRPWLWAVLALSACGQEAAPRKSRSDAVLAKPQVISLEAFCDSTPGKPVALPKLDEPLTIGPQGAWVNVWATWCGPCVEELPMLIKWWEKLRADGVDYPLVLVSADEDPTALKKFYAKHPDMPETARFSEAGELEGWLAGLGLAGGVSLPVHLAVDGSGKVQCLRASAIDRGDFEVVSALAKGQIPPK